MGKFLIGALIGLVLGGVIVFFVFVGVPGSGAEKPGEPIRPPSGQASRATVQVVLSEAAFNEVLNTIFQDLHAPTFPTALGPRSENSFEYAAFAVQAQCPGQIRILNEGSGVRTGVNLSPGRISAPMAFTGSMSTIIGCVEFTGWAEARLDLRFEAAEQAVYGVITVETVNLDGVNPLMTGIVTPLVQSTINQRVNPILILRGEQLGLNVPVTSASGRLTARASDIRAEVGEDAVTFSIEYDFEGTSETSQPPA